jgi:hypothetical protein
MSNQVIYFHDACNKTHALPALFSEMSAADTTALQLRHIVRICRVSPNVAGTVALLAGFNLEVSQ